MTVGSSKFKAAQRSLKEKNCQKQADERQGMRPKTGMHNGEIKDAPEHHCQSRTMIDSE